MWLTNSGMGEDVKIHLVVLVHVFEEEGPKEYLDEQGGVIMSRERRKGESGIGKVNGLGIGGWWWRLTGVVG